MREEEKSRRQDRGGYFERDDGQKPSNHKDVATQSLGEFPTGATISSDSELSGRGVNPTQMQFSSDGI